MTNLQPGQIIHGFTVIRKRESKKLGGTLYEMTHLKTGAELCFVDNGVENKLFSVAFQTVPENSTGVFHILEHSVLCGSRKFPVREPFLELLKGSMNTFLNALTFPDKTVYPVSSRNEKDFLNLTEVYLDAVFAPLLLENEQIFRQEGWHLALGESGPCYNGVVLNEMKGAMSNVDRRINEGITSLLYPDTCYRFNSGGAPGAIPDLTYEQYVDTYRRFYHPSNARFFLDGDLPLDKTLALIDIYLQRYEKSPLPADIASQTPKAGEATNYYESTESSGRHDILSFARLLGDFSDAKTLFAADVLCDLLASSNESPLKRALLSSGLCEDVELYVDDDLRQPYMALHVRNTSDEQAPEIKKVIRETIARLYREGLSRDELTASLNKMEFALRETEEPQALMRNLLALRSWLYGGDPMLYLDTDGILTDLRAMIPTGGYEELLAKLFMCEDNIVTLHTLPSVTLTSEEEAAAAARAQSALQAMTEAEIACLQSKNEALKVWQQTPDSPEALAALPSLTLADVNPVPKPFITEASMVDGVRVLYHPAPAANGVTHLNLYFPLTSFSGEELSYLSLLPALYTELPTAAHDVQSLQRELKTHIGSYAFDAAVFARYDDTEAATPCLQARFSFLTSERERALDLIAEILTSTDFSDKDRILEIVRQADDAARQRMISSGHALGAAVVRASHSASGAARLAFHGFGAMQKNHLLAAHFDEEYPRAASLIRRFNSRFLGKTGLTVSVTAEEPMPLDTLLSRLPQGECQPEKAAYHSDFPQKTGIRIPAPVAYAVMGYHPMLDGRSTDGQLRVAANILSLSYLWNKVRVQGGAYGAGFVSAGNEGVFSYSYRDPSPDETLRVFLDMPGYLRAFAAGDEPIDKYIISSIAAADPLLSPGSEGLTADSLYFSGITEEIRIQNRRDMLATDRAALLSWADTLDGMKEKNTVCVVAKEDTLRAIDGLIVTEL